MLVQNHDTGRIVMIQPLSLVGPAQHVSVHVPSRHSRTLWEGTHAAMGAPCEVAGGMPPGLPPPRAPGRSALVSPGPPHGFNCTSS